MTYYTAIIILTWIALGVLAIITRENDRISDALLALYRCA